MTTPAKIVVTGATGFIGSALVAALREAGNAVVVVSRTSAERTARAARDFATLVAGYYASLLAAGVPIALAMLLVRDYQMTVLRAGLREAQA